MRDPSTIEGSDCRIRGGGRLPISRPRKREFLAALAEHIGSTRDEIARTILTRPGAEWERIANELDLPLAVVRPPR